MLLRNRRICAENKSNKKWWKRNYSIIDHDRWNSSLFSRRVKVMRNTARVRKTNKLDFMDFWPHRLHKCAAHSLAGSMEEAIDKHKHLSVESIPIVCCLGFGNETLFAARSVWPSQQSWNQIPHPLCHHNLTSSGWNFVFNKQYHAQMWFTRYTLVNSHRKAWEKTEIQSESRQHTQNRREKRRQHDVRGSKRDYQVCDNKWHSAIWWCVIINRNRLLFAIIFGYIWFVLVAHGRIEAILFGRCWVTQL